MDQIGDEHYVEIDKAYLDRLARTWPEPREQLHIGGWQATFEMAASLGLVSADYALDLCCGEGGTAVWLARQHGRRVAGIDILPQAIAQARAHAEEQGVAALTRFQTANCFSLPFEDATFDVVYGQDPDGLAHYARQAAFAECVRVLKKGGRIGFQHWLVQSGVPRELLAEFELATAEAGFPSMRRLSANNYVDDMQAAGFVDIVVEDASAMYERHHREVARLSEERLPDGPSEWVKTVLKIFDAGYKIGVHVTARRP